MRIRIARCCLWLFLVACVAAQGYAQDDFVVIRPVEIQDVLVNPGMGITTFQRFNGDAINPKFTWSEFGPVTRLQQAPTKPDFPDTSIAYVRWYWNAIEPEQGRYSLGHYRPRAGRSESAWPDTRDSLDAVRRTRGFHRTAACLVSQLRCTACQQINRSRWQRLAAGLQRSTLSEILGELVAAAGERYDGNPYLDSVDISSIGYWGEGWSPYMPAFSVQKQLIDIWLKAFPHTTLLMNFDQPEALAYGTQQGAGWRLDCLGDMRLSSNDKSSLRKCWMSIRNKWCVQESKMCGSAVPCRSKPAALLGVGSGMDSMCPTSWTRRCAGTSVRSTLNLLQSHRTGSLSLRRLKRRWAIASSCVAWNIQNR